MYTHVSSSSFARSFSRVKIPSANLSNAHPYLLRGRETLIRRVGDVSRRTSVRQNRLPVETGSDASLDTSERLFCPFLSLPKYSISTYILFAILRKRKCVDWAHFVLLLDNENFRNEIGVQWYVV